MSVITVHGIGYWKVVYKSRCLCAIFQLFGAASIQVWLLFEGGLYAKSWVCKTRKSGLAHVKWKWNLTLRLSQIYFKCKLAFFMHKVVGFSPTWTTLGRFFRAAASIRVQLMCNLSSEKVRLLIKCGFCTRLYGIHKAMNDIFTALYNLNSRPILKGKLHSKIIISYHVDIFFSCRLFHMVKVRGQNSNRRVSHGLGWRANAVLFLPIVKGNPKLWNTSAPTVSNIAHQTNSTWLPFYPIGRASHDLVTVYDRQGKKIAFRKLCCTKNMALAGHPRPWETRP